jgi:putative transposase
MKFFDPLAETIKTRNNLPHWQQSAATYFVTYRLADSIPKELIDAWRNDRDAWLKDNPEPWSEETEAEYHATFSGEMDRMMDRGHGSCVLRRKEFQAILEESFSHFDGVKYIIHSRVVMPNHVHLLFTLATDVKLETAVGTWKRFTARKINEALGNDGALWQKDYFDRIVRDWKHFTNVARYIRRNPVKAKFSEGDFTLWEDERVKKLLG